MEKRANNVKRTSRLLLSILLTVFLCLSSLVAGFPDKLTDTDGAIIDLKELVSKQRVIVITMKTAECPVCQHQLIRIKKKMDVFSNETVNRLNIFTRIFKYFNYLVWGDV